MTLYETLNTNSQLFADFVAANNGLTAEQIAEKYGVDPAEVVRLRLAADVRKMTE